MDWRTTGQMTRAKKGGPFYYHKNHNGSCQKEDISIPVAVKVLNGKRCHNPRCSGVNPTFTWDKNQKLYCSVECCDGYQEWQNEVTTISPLKHRLAISLIFIKLFLNQSSIYTIFTYYVKNRTNLPSICSTSI
jgi:hypothetical protein